MTRLPILPACRRCARLHAEWRGGPTVGAYLFLADLIGVARFIDPDREALAGYPLAPARELHADLVDVVDRPMREPAAHPIIPRAGGGA